MRLLFISLLAALSTAAQTPIHPGDKLIRSELIRPSRDFYRTIIFDSSGKVLYDFMMDDFTFVDAAAGRITFARSRQVPPGSFSTDTSVTDLQLMPIRMHEIHFQRDVSFEMSFDDTVARVRTIRKGVASTRNYPMKKGYFEDNMIEYIFGLLDLKKGVTYTLDNFNKDTPAPSDPYTLEYTFDDIWSLSAGYQLNCRVLQFTHGSSKGLIWIDKNTREVLKVAGSSGGSTYIVQRI
jgi:hypothetical protein